MSSWTTCLCGKQIHHNLFSGASVSVVISDGDYDSLPQPPDEKNFARLFLEGRKLLRCSACGRLAIYWDVNGSPTFYREET